MTGWPSDIAAIIERFRTWTPTGPFEIRKGTRVWDAERWRQNMLMDIQSGPGKRRDRYGAVQSDLRAWAEMRKDS